MDEVSIYNIYDYVNYEFKNNILYIRWDPVNKHINDLLFKERIPYNYAYTNKYLYSCDWVNELKRHISWENGQKVYIRVVSPSDGEIRVIIYDNLPVSLVFEVINEDGYLFTPANIRYTNVFDYSLERCNCVYNNILDEENQPYIFK